jgi:GntR family transcriptional regulator
MPPNLELRVVLDATTPVYRQVVDQVRTMCVDGLLAPGQKLPSVRELAGRLGVHFNTIADAYRALADEGWVSIEHGRGAVIRDRLRPPVPPANIAEQHGSRLRHLVAELRGLGFNADWIRREVNGALGQDTKNLPK